MYVPVTMRDFTTPPRTSNHVDSRESHPEFISTIYYSTEVLIFQLPLVVMSLTSIS